MIYDNAQKMTMHLPNATIKKKKIYTHSQKDKKKLDAEWQEGGELAYYVSLTYSHTSLW